MSNFLEYARYYDLLYQGKDYEAESRYALEALRRRMGRTPQTLLDMGCGTGQHHAALLREGVAQIVGIDRSEQMLAIAGAKGLHGASYHLADLRDLELDREFDAIVSLFHVASYMTDYDALDEYLYSARRHLRPGGVLAFDFWYGPAVIHLKPETRVLRRTGPGLELTRISESEWDFNQSQVKVRFEMILRSEGEQASFSETHPMRYWFLPELERALAENGFQNPVFTEWLTQKPLSLESWNGFATATKP